MTDNANRPVYSAELWNSRYSEQGYAFGDQPNDFLAANWQSIPQGNTLFLAEGEGRNGVFMARQGYSVTGVDGAEAGLLKAQELASSYDVSIETVVADLADYVIEQECYTGIVSIFAHLPVELRRRVHAAVVAGLKPGGVFLLEAYTPDQAESGTGGPSNRDLLMKLEDLKGELAGLDFEIGQEITRDVIEGRYHTGSAHVVQVLARKP